LGYVYDWDHNQHSVRYHGDRHLLTIAPNRSGKGTTAIIPNLLQYQGSIVVIDPKGENAMITAKQRQAMGHDVLVVDPMGITGMQAARLNPLDWLSIGDIEIGDNAMLLADSIIRSEGGDDPFWNEEAKALLRGVMLHVATDPSEDGQRHLGRVRDLLLLDGEDMKALFTSMLQSPYIDKTTSFSTTSAQPGHRLFSLRALAARNLPQMLDLGRRVTAEIAAIHSQRSEDCQGNLRIADLADVRCVCGVVCSQETATSKPVYQM
jgi:type IV secretion system protein VirD4